ncbi:GNAT family N-acetyltransferase [Candidatus Uhrbacteria bacterium]|nr:GNAT family N-acetyltransferase [Candidatus Uhrbacteria bacterium]
MNIRPATFADARRVHEIRNAPSSREWSNNKNEIAWDDHERWFRRQYAPDSPHRCYVLDVADRVVGYCRFDATKEGGGFLLSIALDPDECGKGYGTRFLVGAIRAFASRQPLLAEVLTGNEVSHKLFRKTGFRVALVDERRVLYRFDPPIFAYGLKLWTSNAERFADAARLYEAGMVDFIELYLNPASSSGSEELRALDGVPVEIHAPNTHGFHELVIGREQLAIWSDVLALADRFRSRRIVLHPGRDHTLSSFQQEFAKLEDPRVLIENMPGRDTFGKEMFGKQLSDLERVRETHEICFDLEKAAKAAAFLGCDHREYVADALELLSPRYFHISGGDASSPIDQHLNVWEGSIDFPALKRLIEAQSGDEASRMVFEVPKTSGDLSNDLKNMDYFRSL